MPKKQVKKSVKKKNKKLKNVIKKLKTKKADIIINNNIKNTPPIEQNKAFSIPSKDLGRDDYENKQGLLTQKANIEQIKNEYENKGRQFLSSQANKVKTLEDTILNLQKDLQKNKQNFNNSLKDLISKESQLKKQTTNIKRRETRLKKNAPLIEQKKQEKIKLLEAKLNEENEKKNIIKNIKTLNKTMLVGTLKGKSIIELKNIENNEKLKKKVITPKIKINKAVPPKDKEIILNEENTDKEIKFMKNEDKKSVKKKLLKRLENEKHLFPNDKKSITIDELYEELDTKIYPESSLEGTFNTNLNTLLNPPQLNNPLLQKASNYQISNTNEKKDDLKSLGLIPGSGDLI